MSVDVSTLTLAVNSTGVSTASGRLDQLAKDGARAESATTSLTSSISKMSGFIATAAAGFATWKLTEYIKDATLLAARVETLGVVMKVVGTNAGYTYAQMDAFTSGLKKMGITTQESMSSLIKMAGAQMDLTKSSQLARVAQDAAVIGGINSSEAFGRMINGIRAGEVEILKTMGINVQFGQAQKKLADSMDRTTESLTAQEKVQANMNAVLDFGVNIAGAYEASMSTAGKQMLSMARYTEELKLKIGQLFTPALTFAVTEITRALKDMDTQLGNNKPGVESWGQKFKEVVVSIAAEVTRLSMLLDKAGGSLTSAGMLLFGPGAALGNENSKKQFEKLAAANMEYEKRYKEGEETLQRLANTLVSGPGNSSQAASQEKASIEAANARKRLEATAAQKEADAKAAGVALKAAAAAEQWRVTYADLRKEIDGLAPGMDEYSKKVLDVDNKYRDLVGKYPQYTALLEATRAEMVAALTVQRDIATTEDARLTTEKRLSEEYERQLDHARDFANLQAANDTAAASLVGTNAIGGFDSVADETANKMAMEQDAHNKRMGWIDEERRANARLAQEGARSGKEYHDYIAKLDKDAAIEKQKHSKATGKIADDGYRASLTAASYYTGAASDAFTLLASTQDQSSRSGFESAKAYSIAAAVMNTAAGIMSAFASLPWPAAPIAAALVAATGVVQIAKISSTSFGGGSGSVSAPAGSFSGSATGSGSAIGGSYSSIADRQSNATMTRLADATENASVNMRKVSDGLVKFSGMLDGDADQRALGTVNGQYATLESQKSAMTALMTGGLSNIGSSMPGKLFDGNFQGWMDDQNKTTLAVSGLTSMFGWGNSWKQTGSGVSLGMSGGELDGQGYTDSTKKGGWFSSDKKKTKYGDLSDGFAAMLEDALLGMSSNVGLSAAILGTSSNIGSVSAPRTKIATAGRSTEDIQKDVEAWLQNVGNAYAKTVVGLEAYTYAGEEAYAALMRLTISLQTVNESFSLIGKTMLSSTIAGGNYASKLIDLMGGNEAFSESMDTYFTTMFTQTEQEAMKAAQATKDVSIAFADMGLSAPKTNLEFRNLVNSIDVTTERGAGLFDALMDIVPAFGLMTDAAEEAAKTLRDTFLDTALSAANALKDIMGGELSTLSPEEKYRAQQKAFADAQAAGRTAELPELGKALLTASRSYNGSSAGYTADYATVTAALADVAGMTDSPSLRAANAQVQLLTDIRAILDGGPGNLSALTGQLKYGTGIGNAMGTPDPNAYVGVSWFDKMFDSRRGRANNYNDNSDLIDEIRALKGEVVQLRQQSVGALNSIDTKARLAVNE